MRIAIEPKHVYKLINHGPTTLISSAAAGKRNVMAAAWVMALDIVPPKLCAVIAEGTYTRELVDASGEFVAMLPTKAMVDAAFAVGSVSGREVDKFEKFGLKTAAASKVAAPLVEGCAAWLECKVVREPHHEKAYDLFVAEVVAAWADDASWRGNTWTFASDDARTIHHLSRGDFLLSGDHVKAQPLK
ncbi:MAG: flavin reductase family protein [Myxococcaceae bacterium]